MKGRITPLANPLAESRMGDEMVVTSEGTVSPGMVLVLVVVMEMDLVMDLVLVCRRW